MTLKNRLEETEVVAARQIRRILSISGSSILVSSWRNGFPVAGAMAFQQLEPNSFENHCHITTICIETIQNQ
jgi:hypothetical protein